MASVQIGDIERELAPDITVEDAARIETAPDLVTGQGEPDFVVGGGARSLIGINGDPYWLVTPLTDSDAATKDRIVDAVSAASERCLFVDEHGEELTEEERDREESWTVGYAAPIINGEHVILYVDTDGEIGFTETDGQLSYPMIETMSVVLIEELARRQLSVRVSVKPADMSAD